VQGQSTLSLVDALAPEHIDNPYRIYQQLRDKSPVLWDEKVNAWVVTGYNPVVAGLRDNRFSAVRFTIDTSWIPEEFKAVLGSTAYALTRQMLFLDPPDHTRLRGLVSKAFTPRVIETMRPRIQRLVDELIDQVQPQGHMRVIQDFSYPLPAIVIAEMLGVPSADRAQFIQWTGSFGALLGGHELSFEMVLQAMQDVTEFINYFRQIIAERRKQPKDDLLQAMIFAEEQGDKLSEDELLSNCVLLLAAGHGTTTHLISNGMLALLRHPDQWNILRNEPENITYAVSELLRYDSPVQLTSRKATEDIELGGKHIQAEQEVFFSLGAANYDPKQFHNPDQFDLHRHENRHVAFGQGIHYCLGSPLARLEAEIAFSTLARRLKDPQLETKQLEWSKSLVFRGLSELEISFA
jgi:cytochrome P450